MHTIIYNDQVYANVDLVRAIVSAFSWRDDTPLAPVSTLSIQHELNHRNRSIDAAEILSALATVRDVQRLQGGYWLPSPSYLASGTDLMLVVSGLPNQELNREYGLDPHLYGFGRYLDCRLAQHVLLPSVPLAEWLDAPGSTKKWAEDRILAAQFTDPFGMNNVEVFRSWKEQSRGRWIRLDHVNRPNGTLVLARHQSPDRRANYYLLHLHENRPLDMHELPSNTDDVLRIMCGLRTLGGDPVKCTVTRDQHSDLRNIRVELLPRAEMRLLNAVGRVQQVRRGEPIVARIPNRTFNDVLSVFRLLGCEIESEAE